MPMMNETTDTSADALPELDRLTAPFLRAVSFSAQETPDYSALYSLLIDGGLLIKTVRRRRRSPASRTTAATRTRPASDPVTCGACAATHQRRTAPPCCFPRCQAGGG